MEGVTVSKCSVMKESSGQWSLHFPVSSVTYQAGYFFSVLTLNEREADEGTTAYHFYDVKK